MSFKKLHAIDQLPASLGPKLSADSLSIAFATDASLPIELTNDTDFGTPGTNTLRTAAMLGVGSTAVSNANPVPISDAGGVITVDGTVAATQSGTWDIGDITGTVSLPTGAATEATLVTIDADTGAINASVASIDTKTPALGQALAAASVPVTLPSDQGPLAVSQSGTWNITDISGTVSLPTGAATETTLAALAAEDFATQTTLAALNGKVANGAGTATGAVRVTLASDSPRPTASTGRSMVELVRNDYTSTSVTTGAYVELVASTSAIINQLDIFDSSGQTLVLAIGAAAFEVDTYYISPGGNGKIDLAIPSGSRVSVKAVSATANEGELTITALS